MTSERGRDGAVVLGLVAPSGMPRELADEIAAELPDQLGHRLGDVNWQVRVAGAERADSTPTSEVLKQSDRRRGDDRDAASALGSLLESDEAVREAAYRHHADERTEGDEDQR